MNRRPEIAEKLQGFIEAGEKLTYVAPDTAERALWEDEVYSYLQRAVDQQAATDFRNKIRSGITWTSSRASALGHARACERAIVHLQVIKARVERGEYDVESERSAENAPALVSAAASVFMSHSDETAAFGRLIRFLTDLGVTPLVAEWLPFKGRTVPEHVRATMDKCEAAVVFATARDQVGERSQPGAGALIETGILQERFGKRVIYLVEEGAAFGPMADNFARASFTEHCLEKAFHRIVLELKGYGLI